MSGDGCREGSMELLLESMTSRLSDLSADFIESSCIFACEWYSYRRIFRYRREHLLRGSASSGHMIEKNFFFRGNYGNSSAGCSYIQNDSTNPAPDNCAVFHARFVRPCGELAARRDATKQMHLHKTRVRFSAFLVFSSNVCSR